MAIQHPWSCVDLLHAIRGLLCKPITVQSTHIWWHHDDGGIVTLSHLAQLNIQMDMSAKGHLFNLICHGHQGFTAHPLASMDGTCHLSGKTITHHLIPTIVSVLGAQEAKTFYNKKGFKSPKALNWLTGTPLIRWWPPFPQYFTYG